MKETVYEVRICGCVIVAFNNRDEAERRANILNHIYGHEDYYVVAVEKESL
jgi:hypothetical protein